MTQQAVRRGEIINQTTSSLHRLTPRPPMGWNSYDSFAGFANEKRLLENLSVFAKRLAPHGYQYLVCDAVWYRHFDHKGNEFPGDRDPFTCLHDAFGRPRPSPNFFPNGYAVVTKACHAAGVKCGIHMMRGILKTAVEANTPIKGTNYHARDIADFSRLCDWCADNVGVNPSHPAAQPFYDSLIEMLASWGVDFIKYDDIIPHPAEIDLLVNAIEKCGRDIVLSLSPGNVHKADGWPTYRRANLIRITGDIWDDVKDFSAVFKRWEEFEPLIDSLPAGCWFDQDMIPFGQLQVWNPPEGHEPGERMLNGRGVRRMSELTPPQMRTLMTMQALSSSPIIMGGNLPNTDEYAFELLTHRGMITCNQNGIIGRLVTKNETSCVWKTTHRSKPDAGWFGIFNRDHTKPQKCQISLEKLGIPAAAPLMDVWTSRPLTAADLSRELPADDVLFVRYGNHAM